MFPRPHHHFPCLSEPSLMVPESDTGCILEGPLWGVQACPQARESKPLLRVCRPNLGVVMGVGDKLLALGKPRRGHTRFGPMPGCTGSA